MPGTGVRMGGRENEALPRCAFWETTAGVGGEGVMVAVQAEIVAGVKGTVCVWTGV